MDLLEQHRLQMIRLRAKTEAKQNGGIGPAKTKPAPRPKPVITPRPKRATRTVSARTVTQAKPTTVDMPGDELHAIYESLTVKTKGGCKCKARITEMNAIGSAGCRARFDEIVGWQREGMQEYTWTERATAAWHMLTTGLAAEIGPMNWTDPFPALVDLAIKRAEAKLAAEKERQEAARRPFVLNPDAKICVVTAYTPENPTWLEIGRQTSETMRAYCERQGYGFRLHTDDFEPGIHPSWSKIKFLKAALEHHETVLWLDADALVTNPYQRIENLHTGPEELCLCSDSVAMNCGVILLRRSPFATWLLNQLWADRLSKNRLWEQDTMQLLLHHGELSGHLRIYPPRQFNSCVPSKRGGFSHIERYDWRPGDFIAHIYHTGGVAERKVPHVKATIVASAEGVDESVIQSSREFLANIGPCPVDRFNGRGIVTSAGGPVLQLNAYVMLRLLRHLGCSLPVECWYDGDRERDESWQRIVQPLGVTCVDGRARGFRYQMPSSLPVHAGTHKCSPRLAVGLNLKVFAVAESSFSEVLWIDADSFPVRDPSFVFDDNDYLRDGSMVCPDPAPGYGPNLAAFGCAGEFREGLETGQMAFSKSRTWRALQLNVWYNEHADYFYRHSWTDKDTMLAALLMAGLPVNNMPICQSESSIYGQYGPDGELMFCHRVGNAKLTLDGNAKTVDWFPHNDLCQQFIDDYRKLTDGSHVSR